MTSNPNTPLANSPAPSPLTPEQLLEFRQAELNRKKLDRAISVARTDAQITAFFAAVAVLSYLMSDLSALLIGVGLGIVAINSFRGSARLRKFDRTALSLLAWNQGLLALFLTLYFLWSIYSIYVQKDMGMPGLDPADLKLIGWDAGYIKWMAMGMYAFLIFATWIAQGLVALYYLTRRKHFDKYIDQTPTWVVELQKAQRS